MLFFEFSKIFIFCLVACFCCNRVFCDSTQVDPFMGDHRCREPFQTPLFPKIYRVTPANIYAFFNSQRFFQLSLSVAYNFNELSLKCCLSVAHYIEALSYQDTLYFADLSLYLHFGLFISSLCRLFFHYHFHFH